ncbi:MAG: hypothetical protein PQJ61_15800 [Spirochaetales bacterium]|uniref:Uncharacterized protein n=1 Tax=Candidatus Thalassospirochaeta sargassi TaxID=3119039 RepID=A0AAJ1MLS7_9SPIO|nr:hypothetical protein [Spirochaetales bacterium]
MDLEQLIDGRIGDGMVKMGEMTESQVRQVLKAQSEGDSRLFGEIAVDMEFIDIGSVIRYMEQSSTPGFSSQS